MHIRKDHKVIILAGKDKGKKGSVIKSLPKENKVIVGGLNMTKVHNKPRRGGEKGQVVEKAMPIHISNVALMDPKTGKATRIGKKMTGDKKTLISKKSGSTI
ncbi:MAG: 50S ribosomal protein L24 [Candidatus Paceibacterota bacterium]